jgi:histidinol dehydrogenase
MADIDIRRLSSTDSDFDASLAALTAWDVAQDDVIARAAAGIVAAVRDRGDAALLEYTKRFDRLSCGSVAELEVAPAELAACADALPRAERDALDQAAQRIRAFHDAQQSGGFEFTDALGNTLGNRVTPLDRVGVYVPGGQAAYPSTVLMTVIPARVAGVGEVIVTVPTPNGVRNPLVFAAMHIAGVDRVFCIGGAQAIGALAFGTDTVPRVDKIVGPGGAYVAAAKRLVFGPVGIDIIAGPSEILVISDGSAPADWLALDLFSQAEHDTAAQAMLLSPDSAHLDAVYAAMRRLLPSLSRRDTIARSLADRGALIHTRDLADAVAIANRIAPEHLELAVMDPDALLPSIRHAGAIFLGSSTSEALGDYVAGPSHVLPTFGTARFASPLGVYDFQKRTSVIRCSPRGAESLGRLAVTLATGEGLTAHARSAAARMSGIDHNA